MGKFESGLATGRGAVEPRLEISCRALHTGKWIAPAQRQPAAVAILRQSVKILREVCKTPVKDRSSRRTSGAVSSQFFAFAPLRAVEAGLARLFDCELGLKLCR